MEQTVMSAFTPLVRLTFLPVMEKAVAAIVALSMDVTLLTKNAGLSASL